MKRMKDHITTIIMIAILLMLSAYIIYDKIIMVIDDRNQKINEAAKTEEGLDLAPNSQLVVSLYNILSSHSKLNGSYDDSWVYAEEFYNYKNKEVTIDNLSNNQKLQKAFWYLYREESMDVSQLTDKDIERAIENIYGKNVTYTNETFEFDIYTCNYDNEIYNCEKTKTEHKLLTKENYKISKALSYESEVVITEYFYYPEIVGNNVTIYNNYSKSKKIATLSKDEYLKTNIFTEYKSDISLYKHHYKKLSSSNYYWYKTEPIEEE